MARVADRDNTAPSLLPPCGQDVKQWRLKRALVTALGQLGQRRAVPVLETMLTRGTDYFPVTSQLAVALDRLASPSSVPVLADYLHHLELNTRHHAQVAHARLTGQAEPE